ncbi:hypothetical protein PCO86_05610 [Pectobacteriaceae bacterium CE70]|nr:hypothetical protein PCO87_05460 [Pectobacteriaceae bacterium C52]WJV67903.1 hypothetical protein PCO86_05610 [Pectobacteriaceae bacterium CE70]WJY11848.1 hypothetical protein PCO80_05440 [Pectobacteriaceae bacterium C80]
MLLDIGGIGLDIFVEQPTLFPLEGFAFSTKAPLSVTQGEYLSARPGRETVHARFGCTREQTTSG